MAVILSGRRPTAVAFVVGGLLAVALGPPPLQGQGVTLTFAADSVAYAPSVEWYELQWNADRARIIRAMETASGLHFPSLDIRVVLYLGVSYTGTDSLPMHLNVRYPLGMALVHELGHRLNGRIRSRPADMDEHKLLYLWLYDAWVALYGKRFADAAVAAERGWDSQMPRPFFGPAWEWALAMSPDERASRLRELRERQ